MTLMNASGRFRYSAWDGTQKGFRLDARTVMAEITDDVLYHGDLDAALRRLLQEGMEQPDGERIQGLRELMDKLRDQRRDLLDRFDVSGIYENIVDELQEVVAAERGALDQQLTDALASNDQNRIDATRRRVEAAQMELDLLSPDLSSLIKELQQHDFASPQAEQRFHELIDQLREQLMANQVRRAHPTTTPSARSRRSTCRQPRSILGTHFRPGASTLSRSDLQRTIKFLTGKVHATCAPLPNRSARGSSASRNFWRIIVKYPGAFGLRSTYECEVRILQAVLESQDWIAVNSSLFHPRKFVEILPCNEHSEKVLRKRVALE